MITLFKKFRKFKTGDIVVAITRGVDYNEPHIGIIVNGTPTDEEYDYYDTNDRVFVHFITIGGTLKESLIHKNNIRLATPEEIKRYEQRIEIYNFKLDTEKYNL